MTTKDIRIETDFIGSKELPQEAYYGIQTIRGMENFKVTGQSIDSQFIIALGMVKKAAAKANMDAGLLEKSIGNAIVWGADQLIAGRYQDQFKVDPIQGGAGTSLNMNSNEVIANLALEHLGRNKGQYDIISPTTHVNMSQSTNDTIPTAGNIGILYHLEKLNAVLVALANSFGQKGVEFDPLVKMGRTHLQDAVPIRLGQEFHAYQSVLLRDINRIKTAGESLLTINLGATAVGTGLNADKLYIEKGVEHLAVESGLPLVLADDLVDATQNTDRYTEVSSALRLCMINLSKIANDLRLMASGPRTGLGEITLPPRQAGSSIMPGKVNPVMAELVNQIAFQVIGNDLTVSLASEAGQFELNVMEPVLLFNLLDSIKVMSNGLERFNKYCVQGIVANEERLSLLVSQSIGLVTAVNPHIGYEKATVVAREALKTGRTVRGLCIEYGYLTTQELDVILDAYEMTNIGISGKELLKERTIDGR